MSDLQLICDKQVTDLMRPLGWATLLNADGERSFSQESTNGITYTVNINAMLKSYGIQFDPVLSVSHSEVSRLFGCFLGVQSRTSGMVGKTLAGLLREVGIEGSPWRWSIESEEDANRVSRLLVSDIREYAGPFFAKFRTLSDAIDHLESQQRWHQANAILAVAFAVSGDMFRAQEVINEFAHEADSQPETVARQSRDFMQRFRDHFRLNQ